MHPAQFRTIRESLLLTVEDISKLTLVKDGRIKAWEAGFAPIPEGVAGLISDINREIERSMADAMKAVGSKKEVTLKRFQNFQDFQQKGPSMAPIPDFLAFKCHCALIMRLNAVFKAAGKAVSIEYTGLKAKS